MTFSSPVSLQRSASSMHAATAWVGSGAGTIPSVLANRRPAAKHSDCGLDDGLDEAKFVDVRQQRRHSVVPQSAGVNGVGNELVAERVHFQQWREPGRVAEV